MNDAGSSVASREHAVGGVGRQVRIARQVPEVEHGREGVQMLARHLDALPRRSHRVPDLEPRVPERIQEPFCDLRDPSGIGSVVHDQQIDVGPRKLPPPAVAPHRRQCDARRRSRRHEHRLERSVERVGTLGSRPRAVVARRIRPVQRVEIGAESTDGGVGFHGRGHRAPVRPRRDPSHRCGCGSPVRPR